MLNPFDPFGFRPASNSGCTAYTPTWLALQKRFYDSVPKSSDDLKVLLRRALDLPVEEQQTLLGGAAWTKRWSPGRTS